ncbi:MAG TPA: universal stress protein, partial [Thermoanaerobaculia bacterium]
IQLEPASPSEAPSGGPLPTLGAGTVIEEIFAGSSRRVRVRIPEQAGLRQIFPIAPFGETGILVDAVVPADRTIPDEVSVGLKGWRVLAQPEPRVLAVGEASETGIAAARLARAIGAGVTVLGVAKDPDRVDRVRAEVRDRLGEDAAGAEIRVRSGERMEQILSELSESFYDLVVTDGGGDERRRMAGERTLLQRSRTPILFARHAGEPIRSLLICTAVGEPGRNDVRFGGWFAARLKARVRLLHVAAGNEPPPAWVRSHLERGVLTLRALGVEGDSLIAAAKTPLEGILAEAKSGHDLVVIGRHAGRARSVRGKDDVTFQVLRSTDRPVLVVPADA